MVAPPFPADEPAIHFHSEDIEFDLPKQDALQQWIETVIRRESGILQQLTFIFCSDHYLHALNVEYLQHDDLTDVITFPYQKPPHIEGDIFISIDRVRDNAASFGTSFEQELHRVMIHGVLHLCGYADKTPEAQKIMTAKEDEALGLL